MSYEVRVVHAEKDFGAESLNLDCTLELPGEINLTNALVLLPGILT